MRVTSFGLPDFRNISKYGVYYGDWSPELVDDALNYDLVILHPKSNITREHISKMQANGTLVIGYLSVGEDDILHLASASQGKPGQDGIHANWYYYDEKNRPIKNQEWDSYFTKSSNPEWQHALKVFRNQNNEGWYGFRYLIDTLGCDGLFLDTIDTQAPKDWEGFGDMKGMAGLIKEIKKNIGPDKHIIINRGLFLMDEEVVSRKTIDTVRASISAFMFENYYEENDREYWEQKLNDEYRKSDGFSVITLDYLDKSDVICKRVIKQLGWTPYIADKQLSDTLHTEVLDWISSNHPKPASNP